ncbi:hypothetical protein SAMN02744037_02793 [Tepidibacter formicigenes DSM 15518]|uniref:Uncharacterized protein n=1 Tax=Tepidibacter formicigenes DSM 15518 TaxID=1123349 RepID=A0A1M6UG88_9FIRM|nr:hypothetical protein SAMN02744037_02793 [Tepidibacter formicigenes DSM 15518]
MLDIILSIISISSLICFVIVNIVNFINGKYNPIIFRLKTDSEFNFSTLLIYLGIALPIIHIQSIFIQSIVEITTLTIITVLINILNFKFCKKFHENLKKKNILLDTSVFNLLVLIFLSISILSLSELSLH